MASATSKIVVPRLLFPLTPSPSISHNLIFRSAFAFRASHWSSYEKNPEEQICPTVVPDHVIHTGPSENYWAPHPQTGVFGPPTAHQISASNDTSAGGRGCKEGSVLNLKAWFRHNDLEDSEKPHFH